MTVDVLVVFPHKASFIEQDIEILGRHFTVTTLEYRRRRDRVRLASALMRARVAIAWFVLGYAYEMVRLAPMRQAKTLLIPGGWDVEALPALRYGAMLSDKARARTSYALARSDRVLPVSGYTLSRVRSLAASARADIMYHGFDERRFVPGTGTRTGVLTVARVADETWRLKGLDTLVEVARGMPSVQFTIVGRVDSAFPSRLNLPENLVCRGELPRAQLIESYQSAAVYVQLSAVESFGCSLAEAMLCGCTPVSTGRGALPEVVGDVGPSVSYGDVESASAAVEKALRNQTGERARERIQTRFPLATRERRLVGEVERLLRSR